MTEREKLIEVMARAQCSQGGFDPNEMMPNDGQRWSYYVPGVTAALTALETAGVRLVPVGVDGLLQELERHIIEARTISHALISSPDVWWHLTTAKHKIAEYRTMLAASPYAPEGTRND